MAGSLMDEIGANSSTSDISVTTTSSDSAHGIESNEARMVV
jgi:hypothetical protein